MFADSPCAGQGLEGEGEEKEGLLVARRQGLMSEMVICGGDARTAREG